MTIELSIDTSTRYASVCVSRDGQAVTELTWRSERNHSVELVPAIRETARRAGVEMQQIEAVFIASGPGGFSALRVGMSTAKALAVALDVPLVSAGTLDIEAQPYLGLGHPVCAIIGAGKNRLYAGSYRPDTLPEYEVMNHDAFFNQVRADTLFCGEGVRDIADTLRERLGDSLMISDSPPPTRRAGMLAYLGHRRLQAGDTDDPLALEPLYLRSSQVDVANRTWIKT